MLLPLASEDYMPTTWSPGSSLDPLTGSLNSDDLDEYTLSAQGENSVTDSILSSPSGISKFYSSYSGADITAVFSVPGMEDKVFGTIRSLSYSVVRDKRPLRLLGCKNPSCWSRSTRLIAGSLVFTTLDRYVWYELLGPLKNAKDALMADILPPFNITITALNEYSNSSRLAIVGVRLVDEGSVIGVDDMYIETTNCVDETTECLTNHGWKKYYEIQPEDSLLTISPSTKNIEWQKPSDIRIFKYSGPMVKWHNYRGVDALVTPNHRWLRTNHHQHNKYGIDSDYKFIETNQINSSSCGDVILLGGGHPSCFSEEKTYSNEFVELIGWAVTEGSFIKKVNGEPRGISISQCEDTNYNNVEKIRNLVKCFSSIPGSNSYECTSKSRKYSQKDFCFSRDIGYEVCKILDESKCFTPEFLSKLTLEQANLLYDTMLLGDGGKNGGNTDIFIQQEGPLTEMFQMLCSMLGKRTSCKHKRDGKFAVRSDGTKTKSYGKMTQTTIYKINVVRGNGTNATNTEYNGYVWCPVTKNSTWLAKRNGNTFWTGNTFVAQDIVPWIPNKYNTTDD